MIPVGTSMKVDDLPRGTLGLIGVNFVIFVFEALLSDQSLGTLINVFGYGPPNWYNPFAVFTSMFLHGDIWHILFNMLFLWIFGSPLEVRVGTKRYLMYYLGTGAAAAVVYAIAGGLSALMFKQPTAVGIGASGAISGIMGLYLYRCYFSKIKMTLPIIYLPFVTKLDFTLPAAPLMLFWFLKDVFFGIETFKGTAYTGTGHWAHIGGFAAGMIVAHVMKYGHEGRIEHLREKIMLKLSSGGGWQTAESELLKLHEIAPEDAEVNHDLARLYLERNRKAAAERHYKVAIESALSSKANKAAMSSSSSKPTAGGYMLMEYTKAFNKPLPASYHLKAAEAFIADGLIDEARRVLLSYMKVAIQKTPATEKGLALFTKILWDLGRANEAKRAWHLLNKNFPGSKLIPDVKKAVSKKPGTLFAGISRPPQTEAEKKSQDRGETALGTMEEIMSTIADPMFILIWFFVNFIVSIYGMIMYWAGMKGLAVSIFTPLGQLIVFIITLMAVLERKYEFVTGWFDRRHQAKMEAEFDGKRTLEKAVASERNEEFKQAAVHYEKYLERVPDNLTARMSLAKLYHRKLDDGAGACRHAQALVESTTPESPIHDEALRILKERG